MAWHGTCFMSTGTTSAVNGDVAASPPLVCWCSLVPPIRRDPALCSAICRPPRQTRRALVIAQPYDTVEIADAGVPTKSGTLKVVRDVYSPELDNSRDILVHLPTSYTEERRRYPVIYMHDGQNLFDDATSFAGAWHVDEALEALDCEGLDAIVVGIPNLGPKRLDEYSPFADSWRRGGSGDRYLQFISRTLK